MAIGESAQDLADLQRQVIDRRAELLRAYNVQIARAPLAGDTASAWSDLASRSWDYGHESFSYLNPSGQDDRGRKLLGELAAMRTRFEREGVGKDALPTTPPEYAPPVNPEHAHSFSASIFDFGSDVTTLLIAVAAVYLLGSKR